jgi:hypothetical protein
MTLKFIHTHPTHTHTPVMIDISAFEKTIVFFGSDPIEMKILTPCRVYFLTNDGSRVSREIPTILDTLPVSKVEYGQLVFAILFKFIESKSDHLR